MRTSWRALGLVLVLGYAGRSYAQTGRTVAIADIESRSGSALKGTAIFTADDHGALTVRIEVRDAPPGERAVHIHDKGDCSAPDAQSAGGHWNPTHTEHGKWGAARNHFHLGDIGNINVGPDGKGTLTLETTRWTAGGGGVNDIIGHSIVVHGGTDDFKTQPAGNSGPRIGCGVIVAP